MPGPQLFPAVLGIESFLGAIIDGNETNSHRAGKELGGVWTE